MLEYCLIPVGGGYRVALLAVKIKIRKTMIRIHCRGEIIYMTSLAFDRRISEFVSTLSDMASVAVDYYMNAYERESPLDMEVYNISPVSPIHGSVTFLAVVSKLVPVNVSVTIGAFGSHMGEFQIGMATLAISILVGSGKRKTGTCMGKIELRFYKFYIWIASSLGSSQ